MKTAVLAWSEGTCKPDSPADNWGYHMAHGI